MLLAYDDYGPGHVVVLLHAFPLSRKVWASQESSVGAIYRIIAPDLRGFGESAAPEERVYPVDEMADDVAELLSALQINEPIVVGGLSMGGYVALSLVARYPQLIRGLILMDTRASADSPEQARQREELARKVEETRSVGHVVEAMLPRLLSEATRTGRPEKVGPIASMMRKNRPHGVAAALRGLAARPDRTGELAKIRVPTLVLAGADDVVTPPAEMEVLARAIRDARFERISQAGHLSPWENPEEVDAAMLRFLDELPEPPVANWVTS